MVEIAAGNLVEIISAVCILALTTGSYFIILILKELTEKKTYNKLIRTSTSDQRFLSHEHSTSFSITWFLSCLLVSVLFPLYFSEVYENFETIESGAVILSLLIVYHFIMMFWCLTNYVLWRNSYRLSYFILIVGLLLTIAEIVVILVTLHDQHWTHYASLLLLVPIFLGMTATNSSKVYRLEIFPTLNINNNNSNLSNLFSSSTSSSSSPYTSSTLTLDQNQIQQLLQQLYQNQIQNEIGNTNNYYPSNSDSMQFDRFR